MLSLQMADQREEIRKQTRFDPRALPAVRQVLDEIDQGGLPEALVAHRPAAREGRRRQAQARADGAHARVARADRRTRGTSTEDQFRRLLQEETIVVEFEPVQAKRSLAQLVRTAGDRQKLNAVFDALEDESSGLDERQRELLAEFRKMIPKAATGVAPRAPKALPQRASPPSASPSRKRGGSQRRARSSIERMVKDSPSHSATRIEKDALGEVSVPAAHLWGAQTQRSIDNFPIGVDALSLGTAGDPRVRRAEESRRARQRRARRARRTTRSHSSVAPRRK